MKSSRKDEELFEFYKYLDNNDEQIAILKVLSQTSTTNKMKLDELLDRMVGGSDD